MNTKSDLYPYIVSIEGNVKLEVHAIEPLESYLLAEPQYQYAAPIDFGDVKKGTIGSKLCRHYEFKDVNDIRRLVEVELVEAFFTKIAIDPVDAYIAEIKSMDAEEIKKQFNISKK